VIAGLASLGLAVVPLALDTFATAAVVGASRPTGWTRARVSAIFVLCEGGMPLVGLALGASVGQAIGALAGYVSGALLLALAVYLCWADSDDDGEAEGEATRARRLNTARGLAVLGLGLSISVDELAIGFGVGLGSQGSALPVHQVATLITVILVQTLLVSQLALSLGARISSRLRERVEALTGPGLALLGGYLLAGELLPSGLLASLALVIITVVLGIPAIVAVSPPGAAPHPPPQLRRRADHPAYPGGGSPTRPRAPQRLTRISLSPGPRTRPHHRGQSRPESSLESVTSQPLTKAS